jgi:hypothetical protein
MWQLTVLVLPVGLNDTKQNRLRTLPPTFFYLLVLDVSDWLTGQHADTRRHVP